MLPAITTTHAVPRKLPSGKVLSKESPVRCPYCLAILGNVHDGKGRQRLQAAHICNAKLVAKKPAASVPYN